MEFLGTRNTGSGDRRRKKDELNPVLLVLGISALIFFGVFMICNWFESGSKSKMTGVGTLKSIKNPKNSISPGKRPQIPRAEFPSVTSILPLQPTRRS